MLSNKDRLVKKIEDECKDIGTEWMEDYGVSLEAFKQAEGAALITLCEILAQWGECKVSFKLRLYETKG